MEFLNITAEYDTLALSRIEGIDTYNSRFNLLVTNLKKKPYDILNHRKDNFDIDFADFKLQLEEFNVGHCFVSHITGSVMLYVIICLLQTQLREHMDSFYQNLTSVQRAIEFTQRFQRCVCPCLENHLVQSYCI